MTICVVRLTWKAAHTPSASIVRKDVQSAASLLGFAMSEMPFQLFQCRGNTDVGEGNRRVNAHSN